MSLWSPHQPASATLGKDHTHGRRGAFPLSNLAVSCHEPRALTSRHRGSIRLQRICAPRSSEAISKHDVSSVEGPAHVSALLPLRWHAVASGVCAFELSVSTARTHDASMASTPRSVAAHVRHRDLHPALLTLAKTRRKDKMLTYKSLPP